MNKPGQKLIERFLGFIQRMLDIMVQSYVYELIEKDKRNKRVLEGVREGKQEKQVLSMQGLILYVLQLRFKSVPSDIVKAVMRQKELKFLQEIHRRAVTVNTLEEFKETILHELMEIG